LREAPGVNETLCRALLRAHLTEEDVAAHLQVDPKTVRRWLEGRLPFLRHRWALASMLGVDETDLWPQLRAADARSAEVRAIYPRLDAVPREVWLGLFTSAKQEIDILTASDMPFAGDPAIMAALTDRVRSGVSARVCLAGMYGLHAGPRAKTFHGDTEPSHAARHAALCALLRQIGGVQIRQYQAAAYHAIYRADNQLLVSQHAYGVPPQQTPVLRLQHAEGATMVFTYLAEFERIWAQSSPGMGAAE
jgi:transcriptional regulator with XRE-family HTH domain